MRDHAYYRTPNSIVLFCKQIIGEGNLFNLLLVDSIYLYQLVLNNNNKINVYELTNSLQTLKYRIDAILSSTIGMKVKNNSLDELNLLYDETSNELAIILKEFLPKTTELIFQYGSDKILHVLIKKNKIHCLTGPAVFSENEEYKYYYINDEVVEYEDFNKHPQVKILKILKIKKRIKKNK